MDRQEETWRLGHAGDPWAALLDRVADSHSGNNLPQCWMVPKPQHAVRLRQALGDDRALIVVVDTLRQDVGDRRLHQLKHTVFDILGPSQLGQTAGSVQGRWQLAHDYVSLALLLMLSAGASSASVLQAYRGRISAASAETQLVEQLVALYGDDLQAVLASRFEPVCQSLAKRLTLASGLVWIDDDDPELALYVERLFAMLSAQHGDGYRLIRFSMTVPIAQPFDYQAFLADCRDLPVDRLSLRVVPGFADQVAAVMQHVQAGYRAWQALPARADQTLTLAVLDARLARRVAAHLRSMTERETFIFHDEWGWSLSTTAVVGWITQWWSLGLPEQPVLGDFCAERLRGLWLAQWLPSIRLLSHAGFLQALSARMAQAPEGASIDDLLRWLLSWVPDQPWYEAVSVADWSTWQQSLALMQSWLARLALAKPLADWASEALQFFQAIGAEPGLLADEVGQHVLSWLQGLAAGSMGMDGEIDGEIEAEVDPEEADCDLASWLGFWQHHVEHSRFVPARPEPPRTPCFTVRMRPLLTLTWEFREDLNDVLLLGAAERWFAPAAPGWLPPAVSAELGLPDTSFPRRAKMAALWQLMLAAKRLTVIHAASGDQGPESLASLLGMWRLGHMISGHMPANTLPPPAGAPDHSKVDLSPRPVGPVPLRLAAPWRLRSARDEEAVARLSVGDLCRLTACPLALAGLAYAQLRDEASLAPMPPAQLMGQWVHAVLERCSSDADEASIRAAMRAVTAKWSPARRRRLYPQLIAAVRWIEPLTSLLRAQHEQGWRLQASEQRLEGMWRWEQRGEGFAVSVKGRLDRLERHTDGAMRIVDIKTSPVQRVRAMAKTAIDFPQLLLYSAMFDGPWRETVLLDSAMFDGPWRETVLLDPRLRGDDVGDSSSHASALSRHSSALSRHSRESGNPGPAAVATTGSEPAQPLRLAYLAISNDQAVILPLASEDAAQDFQTWLSVNEPVMTDLLRGEPAQPRPGEACDVCPLAGACRPARSAVVDEHDEVAS